MRGGTIQVSDDTWTVLGLNPMKRAKTTKDKIITRKFLETIDMNNTVIRETRIGKL